MRTVVPTRRALAALAAATAVFATAACGSSTDTGSPASSGAPAEQRTLTVLAAASLTESFTALEKLFEAANPGVDVKISFAGSSALVQQITNGSPADVFASADEANMKKVADAGRLDGTAQVFATNKLTIAVPPGNPGGFKSFADLAKAGATVVVCAPQVPCGSAAEKIEKATGVTLQPVSEEQDVKAVLTKVQAKEADAGLVYVTDANSAKGKVERVDFAEADQAVNRYPIARLKDAPQAQLARAFVELVRSDAGQTELKKVGFSAP